jgi:putative transposase
MGLQPTAWVRPAAHDETIVDLIVRMALENRSWGCTRIRGALANLGHEVGRSTIANILRELGIEPAPERNRHTRWSTFLLSSVDSVSGHNAGTVLSTVCVADERESR